MSTFNNTSKTATASMSNLAKNSGTWYSPKKAGSGWNYDEASINYDSLIDPLSNLPVYYDGLGTLPSWVNLAKN